MGRNFRVLHSDLVRKRQAIIALAVVAFILTTPLATLADSLQDYNSPWRFETPLEQAQKAAILALILQRQNQNASMAGGSSNSTNTTNYNIAGDYVDCNLTSQSLGNQGTVSQNAPVASPSIGVGYSTSSAATGNSGSGTVTSGGSTSTTGATSQSGDTGSVSNTSTAGGSNSIDTTQNNDGSSQNSSADGNSFDSTVSGISGNGGGASVALNSTQTLSNSNLSSSISNSSACHFNTETGNVGAAINSGGQ